MGHGVRTAALRFVRTVLGPGVRRARREAQWRVSGIDYGVRRSAYDESLHRIATHSTPLIRELSGLDMQLQQNKIVNLLLAAERLNGVVIEPGQRLSFWREVGKPTAGRGFVDGLVLAHGRLGVGVGGGLCQMTNLLYWMTLHTPLDVVERWRHSYDVFPDADRTQPFGSGATCAWPVLDLQIENRTDNPYSLSVRLTESHLVGEWRSSKPLAVTYRIEERGHRMTHDGPGRYVRHNELWRIEHDGAGTYVGEMLVAANAALMMYEPFLPPAAAS
ncbi:MAG: VanW family protein [Coriobacteriia bacterium]